MRPRAHCVSLFRSFNLSVFQSFDLSIFRSFSSFGQENTRLLRQAERVVATLRQEQVHLKKINAGLATGLKKYQDALEELHPQVMELKIVQNENVKVRTCFAVVVGGGGWW